MIYVFDTGPFVVLRNYYPATFKSLWAGLEGLVETGTIVSTREVYNELLNFNDAPFVQEWAKAHKTLFATPANNELQFVSRIFQETHFRSLIGNKEVLKGTPVADPFVIAAAAVWKGTVVTQEVLKENAAKIPNVCDHFKIPYTNLEGFMNAQGWMF
ncbi:MAG: PIN domain-containing protein [Bacteroidota bacterium]